MVCTGSSRCICVDEFCWAAKLFAVLLLWLERRLLSLSGLVMTEPGDVAVASSSETSLRIKITDPDLLVGVLSPNVLLNSGVQNPQRRSYSDYTFIRIYYFWKLSTLIWWSCEGTFLAISRQWECSDTGLSVLTKDREARGRAIDRTGDRAAVEFILKGLSGRL